MLIKKKGINLRAFVKNLSIIYETFKQGSPGQSSLGIC